jgi:hypothetical protein
VREERAVEFLGGCCMSSLFMKKAIPIAHSMGHPFVNVNNSTQQGGLSYKPHLFFPLFRF